MPLRLASQGPGEVLFCLFDKFRERLSNRTVSCLPHQQTNNQTNSLTVLPQTRRRVDVLNKHWESLSIYLPRHGCCSLLVTGPNKTKMTNRSIALCERYFDSVNMFKVTEQLSASKFSTLKPLSTGGCKFLIVVVCFINFVLIINIMKVNK